MKQKRLQRHVKGFTLIELIIVIAIIGILLGILMPTMTSYYRRSRIQAANSNAKMVYNAAQTAIQKEMARDRTATDKSGFENSNIRISYNRSGTTMWTVGANAYDTNPIAGLSVASCQRVADAVNRTVSNGTEINWAIRIDNYIVKGAVSADSDATTNVGFYSANRQFATMDTPRAAYSTSFDTQLGSIATGYDAPAATEAPTTE